MIFVISYMISYFLVWYHIWYYEKVWYHRRLSLSCQKISDIIYDIMHNIKWYWHISYEIVENIKELLISLAVYMVFCVWFQRTSDILAIWYHVIRWDFQAETWNFKLELEISRWKVLDLMFLAGSPYVLVLIARSTFKLGLVGASSGSQVPFSRVSHSRQAAGWLPVTVSLSQHLKFKSARLVWKGQY